VASNPYRIIFVQTKKSKCKADYNNLSMWRKIWRKINPGVMLCLGFERKGKGKMGHRRSENNLW